MKTPIALGITLLAAAAANSPADNADSRPERVSTTIGTNQVSIQISGGERVIHANGWPDHAPGTFPRHGNPNTISTQNYGFQVPVNPQVATIPTPVHHGVVGIALNGIPFDPATAEFWNDDPGSGWNYEARSGFIDLGLDQHNAHVQPNGAYHYHGLPIGLVQKLGGEGSRMLLVG